VTRLRAIAAIVAATALPFGMSNAEVFKCVDGGRTVYQDQPCPQSAKATTLAPVEPRGEAAPVDAAEVQSRLRTEVDELARQRRKRELAREIGRVEDSVQGYQRAEDAELALLRDKHGFTLHNLAAASWQREAVLKGIDAEMQGVKDKYGSLREVAATRLVQLRKEATSLDKPR
jgi:hypothetical protein